MASRHGSAVRGQANVPHSSIRDQRFGRMFRNLPQAQFTEEALTELAETMLQGEFARRIAAGVEVDTPLDGSEPKTRIRRCRPATPISASSSTTTSPSIRCRRSTGSTIPDALQDFRTPRLDLEFGLWLGPGRPAVPLRGRRQASAARPRQGLRQDAQQPARPAAQQCDAAAGADRRQAQRRELDRLATAGDLPALSQPGAGHGRPTGTSSARSRSCAGTTSGSCCTTSCRASSATRPIRRSSAGAVASRRCASTRRRGAMPSFRSSFPSPPTATAIRWCGRAMR